MISASDSSSKTSATPIARIHLHRGKKKSIYKAWTNKEFFQVGNYIWLLYFHFHFSVSSWKSGRKIPSIYFRALATINPIGQFFIKTNSSSYFSPYKHFWNYLKLDPIPFALKESLQYLVTWEDHMPKSRHRNRQPFFYVLNSRATFQSTEQV